MGVVEGGRVVTENLDLFAGSIPPSRWWPDADVPHGLWEHQSEAFKEVCGHIRAGRTRVCVVAATGAGKTRLSAELAMACAGVGRQVFFAAPKLVLVDQTLDAYAEKAGLPLRDFGVLQGANTRNLGAPYIVGTPQTVGSKRADRDIPSGVGMVVVDECHRRYNAFHERLDALEGHVVIGLTATPYRKGMDRDWDALVQCGVTDDLVERGVLSPFELYVGVPMDTSDMEYNRQSGDYGTDEQVNAATKVVVKGNVEKWESKCREHFGGPAPTILFSRTIEQGAVLCDAFAARGHDFRQVHSGDDPKERREHVEAFRRGECVGLVSVDVLAEGFDVPDVRVVMFARPTGSKMRLLQSIGRGLRAAPGKKKCVVIDMSNSLLRLWPELTEHWKRGPSGFEREKPPGAIGEAPVKECPECQMLVPVRVMVCPNEECGHVWERKPEEPVLGRLKALDRRSVEGWPDDELAAAMLECFKTRTRTRAWRAACWVASRRTSPDRTYKVACGIWTGYEKAGLLSGLSGNRWHEKRLDETPPPAAARDLLLEWDRRERARWSRAQRERRLFDNAA